MLKTKLRELRISKNLTQEQAAEKLNISAQTVSKWERGLTSPDIYILPRIAKLFCCSIDYLFDMETSWTEEHEKAFIEELKKLLKAGNVEGVYNAFVSEIEIFPDVFQNYTELMRFVIRNKMFDKAHSEKMLALADYVEKHCSDDDIRNEVSRLMINFCSCSECSNVKKKTEFFYKKLPKLAHSREIYAKYYLKGDECKKQVCENIVYLTDLLECSVRQLITPNTEDEEKVFYYKKAAECYEFLLDGKREEFYGIPLMSDYANIALISARCGDNKTAGEYVEKIFELIKINLSNEKSNVSKLIVNEKHCNSKSFHKNSNLILNELIKNIPVEKIRDEIIDFRKKFLN